MSKPATQAGFPPVRPKVPWRVANAQIPLPPSQVRLGGLLGGRMRTNVEHRLLAVDEDALLHRFRERTPSSDFANAWAGEHAGKFLAAACRSLATETNDRLADKVRRIAHGLIGAQDADGYLGTYVDADRWTGWDVWVHKYVLIGLLAYYRMEGNPDTLASCCAIGDRLVADFVDPPAGRDVNAAGWFFGMAATSILEPVCDLYRMSGDLCYLAFAEQIVESWERRGGAHILSALRSGGLDVLPSGKAYEFLSNIVGLVDLYRLTGTAAYLETALTAWDETRQSQLYATGSLSAMEHFQPHDCHHGLPSSNIAETCVTVTWLQLSQRLFHLTGEPRFGAECERGIFNHLLAAQDPRNGDFCYYTALCGAKEYSDFPLCCVSSGPRAIAAIPDMVWSASDDTVTVNIVAASSIDWAVGDNPVKLAICTDFPVRHGAEIVIDLASPTVFTLRLRVPDWATAFVVDTGEEQLDGAAGTMFELRRQWQPGNRLQVRISCRPELLSATAAYPGRVLLRYGPQLLTLSEAENPALAHLDAVHIDPAAVSQLRPVHGEKAPQVFEMPARFDDAAEQAGAAYAARFIPFAEARRHNMLLRTRSEANERAPTQWSRAFASHIHVPPGIVGEGALGTPFNGEFATDGRTDTAALLDIDGFDHRTLRGGTATATQQGWIAIAFDRPLTLRRIRFRHGTTDASRWFAAAPQLALATGPVMIPTIDPRIETRWEEVGTLADYPDPADTSDADRTYWLILPEPRIFHGIRINGSLRSNLLSCGDLAALA